MPSRWDEIMAGPGNVQEPAESAQEDGQSAQLLPAHPKGKANRLAVTALICATCVPFLLIAGALGIAFGYIALDEIEESEGKERGATMANWAIGLGFLNIVFSVAIIGLVTWITFQS